MVRLNEVIDEVERDMIEELLDLHFDIKREFTIDDNGYVTVRGNCDMNTDRITKELTKFPIKFKHVRGHFSICTTGALTSLEGIPETCGGTIYLVWRKDLPLLRLVGHEVMMISQKSPYLIEPILNKYKGNPSRANILACQKELIQNGFEGNASW